MNRITKQAPELDRSALNLLLCLVAGVVTALAMEGFTVMSSDQTHNLLPAFNFAQEGFAIGDWYVHQASHIVYPAYTALFSAAIKYSLLVPALVLWFAVTLCLLLLALWRWLRWLNNNQAPSPIQFTATLALILAFPGPLWGEYTILGGEALAAYTVYPVALFLLLALYEGKIVQAGIWALILPLLHPGATPIVLALMLPHVLVLFLRKAAPISLLFTLVFAFLTSAVLPFSIKYAGDASLSLAAYDILFLGRSPHHYFPLFSSFSVHFCSALTLIGAAFATTLMPDWNKRRQIRLTVISLSTLVLASLVASHVIYIPLIVGMFPLRLLPILNLIFATLCLNSLFGLRSSVQDSGRALLVVVMILAMSGVGGCIAAAALLTARLLAGTSRLPMIGRAAAISILLVPLYQVGNSGIAIETEWPRGELKELLAQFGPKLPADVAIVIPPQLEGFRIAVNRAVVVDFKCAPVYGSDLMEWAERMHAVTGLDPRRAGEWLPQYDYRPLEAYAEAYARRDLHSLLRAGASYRARYVIVSKNSRFSDEAATAMIAPIADTTSFSLYRISQFDGLPEPI